MKLKHYIAITILAFVFSAAQASAYVVQYTNDTLFNAAVSGAATYDFTGIPLNTVYGGAHYTVGDATVGGVTFTAPSSTPFVITYGPGTFGGVPFFSGQGNWPTSPSNATATLAGVTGIGFYYSPGDNAGGAITATVNGGVPYNLAVPTFNTIVFVGFTSDTPITSVAFTEQGYGMDIISFELGTANPPVTAPVPIPAAVWLLGTGLVGLVGIRRRLKK
jgi:hypothetical protein